jgi:DNA polymerase-3 subunit alpha
MLTEYKPEDYKGPSEFVHLHNHTVFSAMDGVATPEQYAQQCYDRGYPAMSATEHGHLASVPDMYLAFREYGIKYIPGCEVYYNDWEPKRQQLEKQGIKVRSNDWRAENPLLSYRIARNRHLTILAKNETGFINLVKLTTNAYEVGRYGMGRMQFNRVWFDELCKYKEGLIVLSGCLNGPVSHELRLRELKNKDGEVIYEHDQREGLKEAARYVKKFKEVFGDDYYIELQMPGIPDDDKVFRKLITLADHYKIPTVLANDCHYLNREDFILQKIMMAVAQNTTIDAPDLFHVNSDEQYMKSRPELWARYKNNGYSDGFDDGVFESMCDTTLAIAEKCEPFAVDTSPKIPEIDNADTALRRAVAKSLKERGLDKNTEKFIIDGREVTYVQQAKIELDRFIDKGFASYFLITQDLVNFGRQQGWPFSPRGSAGGSLVCYLLEIHVLNPMVWGLSFDRFLSPSRGGYMLNTRMPEPV